MFTLAFASSCKKEAPAQKDLTIGFIYVGAEGDFGYNQAHAEGAEEVAKLPGVKIREEENVPETVVVQKTMESMITLDGAKHHLPHLVRLLRSAHSRRGARSIPM